MYIKMTAVIHRFPWSKIRERISSTLSRNFVTTAETVVRPLTQGLSLYMYVLISSFILFSKQLISIGILKLFLIDSGTNENLSYILEVGSRRLQGKKLKLSYLMLPEKYLIKIFWECW